MNAPIQPKMKPKRLPSNNSSKCPNTGDAARWQAVVQRNHAADGAFVYAVKTTGIYCRVGCASRRPNRQNVLFFPTAIAAEQAGFRACKRCHPKREVPPNRAAVLANKACALIEQSDEYPQLNQLATAVGVSPFHLQRQFKRVLGVTPKQYALAHRANRLKRSLSRSDSATRAAYDSGFNSGSTAYCREANRLGMTPAEFRRGAEGLGLRVTVVESWLGWVLVAATDRGICAIDLGDCPDQLRKSLLQRFPNATLRQSNRQFTSRVRRVVSLVEEPGTDLALPLDVQGTAFQQHVWQALRKIPAGSKISYSALALRLGRPRAVRAVASACARNSLAVVVPCHRVVRENGNLAGYRWGLERKRRLLTREADNSRIKS